MTGTQYGKKTKADTNIFRQAKQLRQEKPVLEMNEEELEIVKIATMPILLLRQFSEIPIDDGLEELAKIVDEAQRMVAASRGRAGVSSQGS